jgi:hypothetical protein
MNSKEYVQMTSKKLRKIVYGVAVLLLLIAIVCYAAFPIEAPEEPIRLMYQTNAGKVLFDHQTHTGGGGYGLDCFDCHHHTPDDEAGLISCGACHVPKPEEGVIPESCLECHDESEVEDAEYPKRADAFHKQCMQCHEQYGKGPTSTSEDCGKCHVI